MDRDDVHSGSAVCTGRPCDHRPFGHRIQQLSRSTDLEWHVSSPVCNVHGIGSIFHIQKEDEQRQRREGVMKPMNMGKLLLSLFEMGGVRGTVSIRTEQGFNE